MKQLLLILLLIGTLFADFNSLAEEEAYKKKEQSKEEDLRKEYERQLEEKIMPRVENLKKFNRQYYEKYLVKETDTPAMIDEKFKNINNLYPQMIKDYKALVTEYRYLAHMQSDLCVKMGDEAAKKSKNCLVDLAEDRQKNAKLTMVGFMSLGYISEHYYTRLSYFRELEDTFEGRVEYDEERVPISTESRVLEHYRKYLRECYKSYEDRQKEAKADKERIERREQEEEQRKQGNKKYEARSKEVAAERKKVEPACQKWIASLKNQVNSLGVGDKVVQRGGYATPYTIQAVHANIFVVKYSVGNFYASKLSHNVKKSDCIPYDALRSAPSPYCYK